MLTRYEEFLKEFDTLIASMFEQQKRYIKCKRGCSLCCEQGDYPFSQLEFGYLTKGFISLPIETKRIVQQNIAQLKKEKKEFKGERFEHKCPFLINNECSVYQYRGIICRTFGLCYYDDVKDYVRLPGCVYYGLNYADFYNDEDKTLNVSEIIKINLRIDKVLSSPLAISYKLDSGDIRPMLDWFEQK